MNKKLSAITAVFLGLAALVGAEPVESSLKLFYIGQVKGAGGRVYSAYKMPLFDVVALRGGGAVTASGNNNFTGTNTFLDTNFSILDDGDTTKAVKFQVSGVTTGNTVTPFTFQGTAAAPAIGIPDGTALVPAINFQSDADGTGGGLFRSAANQISLSINGAEQIRWGASALYLSGNLAVNTHVTRLASGSTIGWSTTSAISGQLTVQETSVGAAKTLIDATAVNFVQVSVASNSSAYVDITYGVEAQNGTDWQVTGGTAHVAIVNKAGTETCSAITEVGEVTQASLGTLTATITCDTSPTNGINFQMNADSSLNVAPTMVYRVLRMVGSGNITPQ